MTESLIAGQVTTLGSVGLFADGAAVKTVGQETFRVSATTISTATILLMVLLLSLLICLGEHKLLSA